MWKAKRPEVAPTASEKKLEERDRTLRSMIEELEQGAKDLKNNVRRLKESGA